MNISTLIEKVVGDFGDKKRWWAYKERVKQLPPSHRTAIDALERYLLYFGATGGDTLMPMLEDLADLFEQAATDGTPVRAVVGDDPAEFADEFIRSYGEGSWIVKERLRLTKAIDDAATTEESS